MRNKFLCFPLLLLAIVFSSSIFTATANAYDHDDSDRRHRNHYRHDDDSDHKYRKHYRQSRHVRPEYRNHRDNRFKHNRWNRGNKYGHYKKHRDRDYKRDYRDYRHNRHDHRRHGNHRYKQDDPQFIFSLVLPLLTGFDNHYDGY